MALLLNDEPLEEYVKATLYGRSGAGKTTLGCTAPRPLILLSERQGYRSVKDAARRLGIPLPPTIWIQSLSDLMHVLRALQTDHDTPIATALRRVFRDAKDEAGQPVDVEAMIAGLPYLKPDSVIQDSVTEMFSLISDDIERIAGKKVGRDGLEAKPERYWGVLRDRSEAMIRAFRDLPYHVFFLALMKDATIGEGEEQTRVVEPAAPMKALPGALAAAVNLVGLVSVAQEPVKVTGPDGESQVAYEYRRWVRFAGPQWMLLKSMEPLGTNEPPDIAAWLDRIAHEAPTDAPLDLGGVADEHAAGTAPHAHGARDDDAPDVPSDGGASGDGDAPADVAATPDAGTAADGATTAPATAPATDATSDATPDDPAPAADTTPRSARRRRRRGGATPDTATPDAGLAGSEIVNQ